MLSSLKVLSAIWSLVPIHFYSHLYYTKLVSYYRFHFNQPKSYLNQFNCQISRNLFNFYFPITYTFGFFAIWTLNILAPQVYHWHQLFQLVDFGPVENRTEFNLMLAILSFMTFLYVLVGRSDNLLDYRFLSLLVLQDSNETDMDQVSPVITRKDLGKV